VTREQISLEDAKRLIDEAAFGFIVLGGVEQKPVLGDVPIEDREFEVTVDSYRFGSEEADDQ